MGREKEREVEEKMRLKAKLIMEGDGGGASWDHRSFKAQRKRLG